MSNVGRSLVWHTDSSKIKKGFVAEIFWPKSKNDFVEEYATVFQTKLLAMQHCVKEINQQVSDQTTAIFSNGKAALK